jgi:hypothetical protein
MSSCKILMVSAAVGELTPLGWPLPGFVWARVPPHVSLRQRLVEESASTINLGM